VKFAPLRPTPLTSLWIRFSRFGQTISTAFTPRCCWLCIFLFCQFWIGYSAQASNLPTKISFQRLFQNNVIGVVAIEAIIQDRQGYIWIAGENGLLRYDGYDLRLMGQSDSTGAQVRGISYLFVDSRGILWISTSTGLIRYYPEEEKFVRYDNSDKNLMQVSDINTKHMAELPNGELLLATGNGLTIINVETATTRFLHNEPGNKNSITSNSLWAIAIDKLGHVWLGGDRGVDRIHWESGTFTHFSAQLGSDSNVTHNQILAITEDSRGFIWLGTTSGLNRFSPQTGKFTQFLHDPKNSLSLGANNIRAIVEDSYGILWVGTDQGGLNAYDYQTGNFRHFKSMPGVQDSLTSNVVRAIFEDHSGDLWVGNFPTGINFYDRSTSVSTLYTSNPAIPNSLSHSAVMSFSADSQGNYWIGTLAGGINYFDRKTDSFKHYRHDPSDPHSLSTDNGVRTFVDSNGVLWAGTWGGGLNRFDQQTGKFTRYTEVSPYVRGVSTSKHLNSKNVRVVREDRLGNLWLGTQDGALNRLDRKTGIFTHYTPDPDDKSAILFNIVYSMFEDSKGRFWVGTQNSLELMDREKGTFTHFQKTEDPTSLSSSTIFSMFEDSKGRLWFGTSAGLNLLQPDNKSFRHFGLKEGFHDLVVRSIIEAPDGLLWIGTSNGISSFDPETLEVKNYFQTAGWQTGNFNASAVALTDHGELLFGGDQGFSLLKLSDLRINKAVPNIEITDLKLFTSSVKINAEDGLLTKAIDSAESVTFNHLQSVFTFTFAALNFRNSFKNEYAYRLEGFDKEWMKVGSQRFATYTNLDAGDYEFKVIGSNNDGVWNEQGTSIKVRILPPWWETWWAYLIYTVSFFGAIGGLFLNQQLKRRLVEEQNKKLIALDKLKDDFVANTSHELRTPLNGIIGLAESLLDGAAGEVNAVIAMNLKMISASGKRLSNLVNDILDFAKLKDKAIDLDPQPTNLFEVVQTVLSICANLRKNSPVAIINNIRPDAPSVLANNERLQQILYNLIGNAIKFTHAGSITLDAEMRGKMMWIKVIDTGIGIPKESVKKIFNAFEQLEDHRDRTYSGSGLGLAVTQQLVELHGGEIRVESTDGKGSCFMFSLPITTLKPKSSVAEAQPTEFVSAKAASFFADEASQGTAKTSATTTKSATNEAGTTIAASLDIPSKPAPMTAPGKLSTPEEVFNAQFKILIVDDNPINQQVLINQLSLQKYRFAVAGDGQTALRMIETEGPFDLILLDIMMPNMSGYWVCSQLRQKHPMEELPIIFITAKNTTADLVDGFDLGANDFLTKPISVGELNARLKTHLQLLNINRSLEKIVTARTQEVNLAHNELKALDGMVAIINQEIRIERLLPVILHQTRALFPDTDYVTYWKMDEQKDLYTLMFADADNSKLAETDSIEAKRIEPLLLNPSNKIADDIYLHTHTQSEEFKHIQADLPAAASQLCMAFKLNDRNIGILALGSRSATDAFDGMQAVNYERLRTHIDSALSKARLVEQLEKQCDELELMGLTDQLTGLKNRRFLTKYIDHDISLIQRKHYRRQHQHEIPPQLNEDDFIFFIVDIDHFKDVNDTYGHAAGDSVLADMQKIIDPVFRTSDYRIRWGGEEFLIVARFCERGSGPMKAEQLRSAMEKFVFVVGDGVQIQKTCSIGFASYPFSQERPKAFSWTQVINLADLALYTVKNSQRNGWIGILDCGSDDENLYRKIIDDPQYELDQGHIDIATNLTNIIWPR
jgi:two-component system, sensor histidine kinase ChiS